MQQISGYTRRADVEQWAEKAGVPVKPCRGGVWTTLDALNRALGVLPANDDANAPYPADLI
nr:hypothetical protein [Pseudoxanthomonas sp. LH2527]